VTDEQVVVTATEGLVGAVELRYQQSLVMSGNLRLETASNSM